MADLTANFEAGVSGNTITGGAGEASLTAWDIVNGSPVYSNTHPAHGLLAAQCTADGQSMLWSGHPGVTEQYCRIYAYITALPSSASRLFEAFGTSTATAVLLSIETNGKFKLWDSTFGNTVTSSAAIATGQWIRFELHLIHSTTVGQAICRLYKAADAALASFDEELSSPANWNTAANSTGYQMGRYGGSSYGGDVWLDDIDVAATAWIGPVPNISLRSPQLDYDYARS